MSNYISCLVYGAKPFGPPRTGLARRLVMVALADTCNDEGFCFPGLTRLKSDTEMAERTALRTLRDLSEGEWLTIIQPKAGAKRRVNSYQLNAVKLWGAQSGTRTDALEKFRKKLPAAKAHALKAHALKSAGHMPSTTELPALNDSHNKMNPQEPSREPDAAPRLVFPMPAASKPEKVVELDAQIKALVRRLWDHFISESRSRCVFDIPRERMAVVRAKERLKLPGADLSLVEREMTQAIDGLLASEWHQRNNAVKWELIFRSVGDFEDKLKRTSRTAPTKPLTAAEKFRESA